MWKAEETMRNRGDSPYDPEGKLFFREQKTVYTVRELKLLLAALPDNMPVESGM